jgi:hypothetical protein
MPRVRRGSSEPTEDVSEVPDHGSVVSQLRPYSSLGRLGDVRRRKEVGRGLIVLMKQFSDARVRTASL